MKAAGDDMRRRELAKIHVAKKQLSLEDDDYRDILEQLAGVRSAAELDERGRRAVLDRFAELGFRDRTAGRPHNFGSWERKATLRKIEAYLTEAKRPWAYADGIAKRMFGRERLAFCTWPELHKVMLALLYDARRHGRDLEDAAG